MIPGETIRSGAANPCPDCKLFMGFEVLMSGGGFYVGTECDCGPHTRESGYYRSREEAQTALDEGKVSWRT